MLPFNKSEILLPLERETLLYLLRAPVMCFTLSVRVFLSMTVLLGEYAPKKNQLKSSLYFYH